MVDISRGTTGVVLPAAVSNEIWQGVQNQSVVQQVARRIPITGAGVTVPMITGDSVAAWEGETDAFAVSNATLSNKTVTPYKLGLITTFSSEFRRDLPTLYAALVDRLPAAIAKKFDTTVLHGTDNPGTGFGDLSGVPTQEFDGVAEVAAAVTAITTGVPDASISATIATAQSDGVLGAAEDTEGRALHQNLDAVYNRFGGQVVRSQHAYSAADPTVGFVGDFANYAVWGAVGGIEVSVSDQATVGSINLWAQDMFALRVKATMAFGVRDDDAFVRYINAA